MDLLCTPVSEDVDPYVQVAVVNGNTFTVDTRYDFSEAKLIGKGSFGIVVRTFDRIRECKVAIKRVRPYASDMWDIVHNLREVKLMKALSFHPNVS